MKVIFKKNKKKQKPYSDIELTMLDLMLNQNSFFYEDTPSSSSGNNTTILSKEEIDILLHALTDKIVQETKINLANTKSSSLSYSYKLHSLKEKLLNLLK